MFPKKYLLIALLIIVPASGFLFYKFSSKNEVEVSSIIEICDEHGFNKENCYQCNPTLLETFKSTHDWCVEHNLPESQCELCDPFAKFKAKGDWCKEHGAPESQCVKCNPDLATDLPKFVDWCKEHSVPESQCNLCNDNLKFSIKSDWCQDNSVRDSECILCHPELKKPKASPVKTSGNFCEHGFEKGDCFRCDSSLEGKFKKTGDWCAGHSTPESQCFKCQKELQGIVDERLKVSTVRTDLLNAKKDLEFITEGKLPESAFCGTHLLRIKLSSKHMAQKVGFVYSLITKKRLSENLKANSEITYPQNKTLNISSRFSGVVKGFTVQLGDKVKKGQVLASLECPELGELLSDYKTEKQLLGLSQKIYDNTQFLINELKINTLSASEVSKKLSSLEVGEAKIELLNIITEMKTSEQQFELQKELQKEKLGRATEFIDAQKNYEMAYSKFGATIEKYQLKIQRNLLLQLGVVNKLKRKLSWIEPGASGSTYNVISKQDGTIISQNITSGMNIQNGQVLFKVSDLDKMWVKIHIKDDDASRVKIGQPLKFITNNKKNPESFEGKVFWLGAEVDDKTRMVSVLGEINTKNALLRNNAYGQALIRIHDRSDVLTVPKSALQWEGCCHVVFVKLKDDIFAPRKVKLGYEGKDFFEVEAGLQEGELVVTKGSFLLKTEILKSSIGAGCTD